MPEHAPFHFHEPKFVADPEDRPRDRDNHRNTPRLPPIPDLRFEYSYVRSIQPYVHITKTETIGHPSKSLSVAGDSDDDHSYEKVELHSERGEPIQSGTTTILAVSTEVVEVQWGKVLWITTRDQVLSPLIQGALWALAGYYLTPFSSNLGSKLGGAIRAQFPSKEGSAITWLRNLFSNVNAKPSKPRT